MEEAYSEALYMGCLLSLLRSPLILALSMDNDLALDSFFRSGARVLLARSN